MLWIAPLVSAVLGLAALLWCAARLGREAGPTHRGIDRFAAELRPALVRVRDETARTRRRLDPDR